jgi:hypothetical protein
MYARVVRFTDVTRERIDQIVSRIEDADGPPPGVKSVGIKLFFDAEQGTGVFVGTFETEQDLRDSEDALAQMDAADTPGTRASVDRCELVVEASKD